MQQWKRNWRLKRGMVRLVRTKSLRSARWWGSNTRSFARSRAMAPMRKEGEPKGRAQWQLEVWSQWQKDEGVPVFKVPGKVFSWKRNVTGKGRQSLEKNVKLSFCRVEMETYEEGVMDSTGCSQDLLEIYSHNCKATTVHTTTCFSRAMCSDWDVSKHGQASDFSRLAFYQVSTGQEVQRDFCKGLMGKRG